MIPAYPGPKPVHIRNIEKAIRDRELDMDLRLQRCIAGLNSPGFTFSSC